MDCGIRAYTTFIGVMTLPYARLVIQYATRSIKDLGSSIGGSRIDKTFVFGFCAGGRRYTLWPAP
jgi:hypothetical protein